MVHQSNNYCMSVESHQWVLAIAVLIFNSSQGNVFGFWLLKQTFCASTFVSFFINDVCIMQNQCPAVKSLFQLSLFVDAYFAAFLIQLQICVLQMESEHTEESYHSNGRGDMCRQMVLDKPQRPDRVHLIKEMEFSHSSLCGAFSV